MVIYMTLGANWRAVLADMRGKMCSGYNIFSFLNLSLKYYMGFDFA